MFAVHCQLGVAGVTVQRRRRLGALLGARSPRGAVRDALAGALVGAVFVWWRRVPAAPARATSALRRATAFPRLLARARTGLAAVATVAPLGTRLDPVVATARVRPQLRALPELGRRLIPDAALALPAALAACCLARRHARHAARPCPATHAALAPSAARGLAREPLFVERLRQQECVLLAAQPQQPHRQPGGVAPAPVPATAAGTGAAPQLGWHAGRRLGGRALRVGPRDPHTDTVDTGARTRRRGGARSSHEGGVPGVPQAAGAAARLPGAAAGAATAARAARRDGLLTPRSPPSRTLSSHRFFPLDLS